MNDDIIIIIAWKWHNIHKYMTASQLVLILAIATKLQGMQAGMTIEKLTTKDCIPIWDELTTDFELTSMLQNNTKTDCGERYDVSHASWEILLHHSNGKI